MVYIPQLGDLCGYGIQKCTLLQQRTGAGELHRRLFSRKHQGLQQQWAAAKQNPAWAGCRVVDRASDTERMPPPQKAAMAP